MKKIALLLVLSAGMCAGQQPKIHLGVDESCPSSLVVNGKCMPVCKGDETIGICATPKQPSEPAPLKCGKYEHWEYTDKCNPAPPPCDKEHELVCVTKCSQAICVPDLHTVTEQEWQELMERIAAMQKLLNIIETRK